MDTSPFRQSSVQRLCNRTLHTQTAFVIIIIIFFINSMPKHWLNRGCVVGWNVKSWL
ncbi:hypothetical protein DPMN_182190 [Dreissena polymorpha]|uniref:Uncharacterized protein n=1 Tax=Dreissena polymorpha TaxID=45954 RepID=A0A9D4I4D4_DREPO|nr:hypothetical protein DPMN_182190 [Dreissena polymorpha]